MRGTAHTAFPPTPTFSSFILKKKSCFESRIIHIFRVRGTRFQISWRVAEEWVTLFLPSCVPLVTSLSSITSFLFVAIVPLVSIIINITIFVMVTWTCDPWCDQKKNQLLRIYAFMLTLATLFIVVDLYSVSHVYAAFFTVCALCVSCTLLPFLLLYHKRTNAPSYNNRNNTRNAGLPPLLLPL